MSLDLGYFIIAIETVRASRHEMKGKETDVLHISAGCTIKIYWCKILTGLQY